MTAICGPATAEVARYPHGNHWCFVCRKRRIFDHVISAPTEPSYYGPTHKIVGTCGHIDGDLFPGRVRVWEEPE